LLKASLHCIRWSLAAIIFPRLCLIGFSYAQPFLISAAIEFVATPASSQNKNDGYGLIGATALIYIGISVRKISFRVPMKLTECSSQLLTTSITCIALLQAFVGQWSPLFTKEHLRFKQLIMSLTAVCEIWARIIEMAIGIWLLERQLGWVCVAPIVTVISEFPAGV